jgi:dTDP-4-amino-4,6-dideoxygalactose transaminase
MKVEQLDLINQYHLIKDEINSAIEDVLESGIVINGKNVKKLENNLAKYSDNKYGIGVANGSDAIFIALKSLGIGKGDGVLVPPFTFFATAGSVVRAGAIPIFVDIEPNTYNISPVKLREFIETSCNFDKKSGQLINRKTGQLIKAIIPVHLYGQMCKMDEIIKIAHKYNLKVVEDCAQSIGSEYKGKKSGSFGDLSIFSFFPTKNLGTYGDGGMIVTSSEEYSEYCRVFRSHGSKPKYYHRFIGINSRLDEIHAAILNVKFKYLEKWLENRFQAACRYRELFERYSLLDKIKLPLNDIHSLRNHREHTFHQYVIFVENRDKLQKFLRENGIGTNIYYPLCLHLQECFKYLGYKEGDFPVAEEASRHVLAIPMYPELSEEMQEYVVSKIRKFYN